MSDFVYVLVMVGAFGLLALLVGCLDRWLARADDLDDSAPISAAGGEQAVRP